MKLLPEQCRAARGLLDWTQEHLAEAAHVSRSTVRDFEGGRHALQSKSEAATIEALSEAGILFLEADGAGPGVRLRQARRPSAPEG